MGGIVDVAFLKVLFGSSTALTLYQGTSRHTCIYSQVLRTAVVEQSTKVHGPRVLK